MWWLVVLLGHTCAWLRLVVSIGVVDLLFFVVVLFSNRRRDVWVGFGNRSPCGVFAPWCSVALPCHIRISLWQLVPISAVQVVFCGCSRVAVVVVYGFGSAIVWSCGALAPWWLVAL